MSRMDLWRQILHKVILSNAWSRGSSKGQRLAFFPDQQLKGAESFDSMENGTSLKHSH